MNYFVLVSDRNSNETIRRLEYGEAERALALKKRRALKRAHRRRRNMEVVLLEAVSLDDFDDT